MSETGKLYFLNNILQTVPHNVDNLIFLKYTEVLASIQKRTEIFLFVFLKKKLYIFWNKWIEQNYVTRYFGYI